MCTFFDISTSKSGPNMSEPFNFLTHLTWTCASRHNAVHFFNLSTFKSGPKLVCFVHFDLEMCFAPQRRALFQPLNFQKWSEHGVLCTFWLGNVLRATMACNFSSLIWSDGSAPAALASLLFDHPEPQVIGKTQWIATLPFRAPGSSSHSFSSLLFSLLGFSFLALPTSAFPSVQIVGSLTSNLPWTSTYLKDLLHARHNCCLFQKEIMGCRPYWTKHGCIPQLYWAVGCIEQKLVVFPSYRIYTDTPIHSLLGILYFWMAYWKTSTS